MDTQVLRAIEVPYLHDKKKNTLELSEKGKKHLQCDTEKIYMKTKMIARSAKC